MTRRRAAWTGAAVCAIALLLALFALDRSHEEEPVAAASGVDTGGAGLDESALTDEDLADSDGDKPDDERFLRHVRDRFGPTIHNKHTQIKAVEQVMAYLMKMYPQDWQQRMHDFLMALFPDRGEELYAKYEKLLALNDWLAGNRRDLMKLSRRERQQAMWDKRYELFGADADEIWETTRRNEQIADALETIAASADSSVDEKLDTYLQAVDEAWGDLAPKLLENRRTELMNSFLATDSVQTQLRAMPPGQRGEQLRKIRRGMGMDDAALERWDELDSQRDQEWSQGEQYMKERAEIVASTQGDEQQRRLEELRRAHFGSEGDIIGNEEESGFFRFQHPRRIGRE